MKLRILGCSGGIGGSLRTTAILLDHDILIDAGTGVGDLTIDELSRIDHVFLTHSHLDHVTSIPFLVDTVGWRRGKALTVHAIEPTLEILRQHLFNWKLWPDFTQIPGNGQPLLRYESVELAKTAEFNGRRLTPLPANHVVPATGYHVDSGAPAWFLPAIPQRTICCGRRSTGSKICGI
jgi:Cft2 family RNA processing exonuclease